MTKELLHIGGSFLSQCSLKADACVTLHEEALVALSVNCVPSIRLPQSILQLKLTSNLLSHPRPGFALLSLLPPVTVDSVHWYTQDLKTSHRSMTVRRSLNEFQSKCPTYYLTTSASNALNLKSGGAACAEGLSRIPTFKCRRTW